MLSINILCKYTKLLKYYTKLLYSYYHPKDIVLKIIYYICKEENLLHKCIEVIITMKNDTNDR